MAINAVMIDSREPEEIQQMRFGEFPHAVTALDTGDLWLSCNDGAMLIIERKTPSDLLASIGDGRLFLQAQKMRERSPWAYVLITGWLTPSFDGKTLVNNKLTGWNWDSVQGALLDVQEGGVHVAYCALESGYPEAVLRLERRNRAERVLNTAPAAKGRIMTAAETVLTSLPGIGLERAIALLEYTNGNAAQALAWLTWMNTFGDVAGIGPGIKLGVRRALGLEDGKDLTIWSDEAAANMRNVIREEIKQELVTI